MPSDKDAKPEGILKQVEAHFNAFVDQQDPQTQAKIDLAMRGITHAAFFGAASVIEAMELISEFTRDLTGVTSFKVIPKPPMTLEVDIQRVDDTDVSVRQSVAPFVELNSVVLGKQINFEALVNQSKKGLQLNINNGMTLKFKVGPIFQTIPIKGSALLTHDEKGQLAIVATVPVPGLDTPVTTTVPLKLIFDEAQSRLRKKK